MSFLEFISQLFSLNPEGILIPSIILCIFVIQYFLIGYLIGWAIILMLFIFKKFKKK